MVERREVEAFNASAQRVNAGQRAGPPVTSSARIVPNSSFKPYKISTGGQLVLPSSARGAWGLRAGGRVLAAHLGDIVLIVRDGTWANALGRWGLTEALMQDLSAELHD